MGSGKSEELIRKIRRYEIAGKSILCFKPIIDHVGGASISSRNEKYYDKNVHQVNNSQELLEIYNKTKIPIDLVAIDEAQFFDDQIVNAVCEISKQTDVIIAGLEKDFSGNPFGSMPQLLAVSDEVQKLKAICVACKRRYATYTYRKVSSEELILVGKDEIYEARCRQCWESIGE